MYKHFWRSVTVLLGLALAATHAAQALPMPVSVATSPRTLHVGETFTIKIDDVIFLEPEQLTRQNYTMPGPQFAGTQYWTSFDQLLSGERLNWASYEFQTSNGHVGFIRTVADPRMRGEVSFTFQTPGNYWVSGTWMASSETIWQKESHNFERYCLFWICGDWSFDGVRYNTWSVQKFVGPLNSWAMPLTVLPAVEDLPPDDQRLPEPSSLALTGAALLAAGVRRQVKRSALAT